MLYQRFVVLGFMLLTGCGTDLSTGSQHVTTIAVSVANDAATAALYRQVRSVTFTLRSVQWGASIGHTTDISKSPSRGAVIRFASPPTGTYLLSASAVDASGSLLITGSATASIARVADTRFSVVLSTRGSTVSVEAATASVTATGSLAATASVALDARG